jgi:L-alanine-DL-glutamate epimerase-like enolase superfamily enzyme
VPDSDVRILEVEPYYSQEVARTPLKFGAVVVEDTPYVHVRVRAENRRGQVADGWGAIFVMDFWAFPSPRVEHPLRVQAMRAVVDGYCRLLAAYPGYAHPIDIYHDLEPDLRRLGDDISRQMALPEPLPFLADLVCASAADAAAHDAFGIVNGISTYAGYGAEHMGHDLSRYLGPRYAGRYPADYIRPAYAAEVPVFHLIGGLDKLWESEVDATDPQDGLPNSLEAWIERDGLTCLKVKLRGTDLDWDLERMVEVHRVARTAQARIGLNELHYSADTNEQCDEPGYLVEWLRRLRERAPDAHDAILYLEQPTERDLARRRLDMRPVSALKPTILDESLTSLEDMDLALELGWSGIALKTCKGQSGSMLYVARCEEEGIPYMLQDLTNPGIALIQSVGLAARTRTMMGVEANSCQFFPATSTPEAAVHPGIFRRAGGRVSTASIGGPGLGYRIDRIPRDIFRPTSSAEGESL